MPSTFQTPAGGFTLIELLIVVLVVAILAIIIVPSYERYVTESKIQTAQAALVSMGIDLKQYQQDSPTSSYVGGCPVPPPTEDFTLSCQLLSATGYTVAASGTGPLAGFQFSLDQNGTELTVSAPSGWAHNNACWISDPQGDCATE